VVIDKVPSYRPKSSQALTLLTEEAYHKALRYALGIRVWGVRTVGEVVKAPSSAGFRVVEIRVLEVGEWVVGEEFLKWLGRDTLRLVKLIRDRGGRAEVEDLIRRIRERALRHGYGPLKLLVIISE